MARGGREAAGATPQPRHHRQHHHPAPHRHQAAHHPLQVERQSLLISSYSHLLHSVDPRVLPARRAPRPPASRYSNASCSALWILTTAGRLAAFSTLTRRCPAQTTLWRSIIENPPGCCACWHYWCGRHCSRHPFEFISLSATELQRLSCALFLCRRRVLSYSDAKRTETILRTLPM